MNNEVLFLKYLDRELGPEEAAQVKILIQENPEARKEFEVVKTKREIIIDALEKLNPEEEIIIPPFKTKPGKRLFFRPVVLRYTAVVAVLTALFLSFWLIETDQPVETTLNQVAIPVGNDSTVYMEDLDCYISPNRCWNNRQMVWTIISLND
jgi:hypothetical protein